MNEDNTHDGAEPSPASVGSHNTHMATARLSAGNTWLTARLLASRAMIGHATRGDSHRRVGPRGVCRHD
jgi:hypothetical protein